MGCFPATGGGGRRDGEERVTLASELLASIDGPPDPNWEATWLAELDKRHQESPTGSDWFDVRARLINKLAGR
ncbi:MAG: addiction module protein [Polyangiaceae bacterium]|nr:addiction module protein [Polyangiaceae bacterium]